MPRAASKRAGAFLTLLLAFPSLAGAQDAPEQKEAGGKTRLLSRPCVEPIDNPGPGAKFPKFPSVRVDIDPDRKDLFVPMRRKEVKALIQLLKYTSLEEKKGFRLSAEGRKRFSIERMGVLMQDITALLARIHLEETLAALKKIPDADKGAIEWGTQVSEALDLCSRQRYEGFGGDPAFRESLDIVMDNRAVLEELLLESKLPVTGAGAPGGGRPEDIR